MPTIVFLEDFKLTVCRNEDSYYHREQSVYLEKHVKAGEIHQVDFLEGFHDPEQDCRLDVRFADGTVAVGVPNWVFELEEHYNKPSKWLS